MGDPTFRVPKSQEYEEHFFSILQIWYVTEPYLVFSSQHTMQYRVKLRCNSEFVVMEVKCSI